MHLSDKALLVSLSVSQWTAKKLDKKASAAVAKMNNADSRSGNYNKSLLPTCETLGRVHKETTEIRKSFYANTLPWGIDGTFILPSGNYLSFMTEYRSKKGYWDGLVQSFFTEYDYAKLDAQRLLGSMYNPKDYPSYDHLKRKFGMDMAVLPVPASGDFRVELIGDEFDSIKADIEQRVARSSQAAIKDVWQRLFDKVSWLHGRLADPKTTFQDETYKDACDLVKMLTRLNFTDDPELENMRREAEAKLFDVHPQALRNDPVLRTDTADKAKEIMDKMSVFMGGIA